MKKTVVLAVFLSVFLSSSMFGIQISIPVKAQTVPDRYAVIEDTNCDRINVETINDDVWSQLVQLYYSKEERWVGGIVEIYSNEWGFHFDPSTIIVAEVTIEVWQTTIKYISENLGYWLGEMAVVGAKVVEVHQSPPVGGVWIPVDKFSLLAPYIGLTILLAVAVLTVGYVKKRKRHTEINF